MKNPGLKWSLLLFCPVCILAVILLYKVRNFVSVVRVTISNSICEILVLVILVNYKNIVTYEIFVSLSRITRTNI